MRYKLSEEFKERNQGIIIFLLILGILIAVPFLFVHWLIIEPLREFIDRLLK